MTILIIVWFNLRNLSKESYSSTERLLFIKIHSIIEIVSSNHAFKTVFMSPLEHMLVADISFEELQKTFFINSDGRNFLVIDV